MNKHWFRDMHFRYCGQTLLKEKGACGLALEEMDANYNTYFAYNFCQLCSSFVNLEYTDFASWIDLASMACFLIVHCVSSLLPIFLWSNLSIYFLWVCFALKVNRSGLSPILLLHVTPVHVFVL